jgi:putative polyketide hydroxylase
MELIMQPHVLVVGAGPAGLVTAITLGRMGVQTLLVERRSTTSSLPRATGISLRSMELFRGWGLEDQIRAGEMDVGNTSWIGGPVASGSGTQTSLGFPTPEQARATSPTTAVAAPQDHLEPVLLAHLRTYPSVEVRLGTELVALTPEGALLSMDGVVSSVRARFVVGADGARSAVRSCAGIAMEGPDDLGAYYTVTFRAPLAQHLPRPRHGLYMVQHAAGMSIMLPTDNRDRWVFSQPYDPSSTDPLSYSPSRLLELVRAAAGVPDLPVEIERVGTFTFAAQVATTYRSGSVFLVGDAAHRTTPRGGTGMNTAIQDGLAIGWRLAWVLCGWAPTDVLASYEDERRPVGIRNTARSGEVGPRDNSADWLDDLAGRIPHTWITSACSTLDLLGPGLTLLTGPAGRHWAQAVSELDTPVPVEVHGVDARSADVLGIGRDGAILVRPDAIPAGIWPAPDAMALASAISAISSGDHDLQAMITAG